MTAEQRCCDCSVLMLGTAPTQCRWPALSFRLVEVAPNGAVWRALQKLLFLG